MSEGLRIRGAWNLREIGEGTAPVRNKSKVSQAASRFSRKLLRPESTPDLAALFTSERWVSELESKLGVLRAPSRRNLCAMRCHAAIQAMQFDSLQ